MIDHDFICPYCLENQLKRIDFSISNQNFIEDCEVCCNPIDFTIALQDGQVRSFEAKMMD
jgi:hypothetical protein